MPTTPWDPMRNNNKKIQNESTAFPGITKDAEAKILATAEKQGKTQYERNLIANDLYKVALKEQNNLNFINERTGAKQELYQKSLQSKDKNQSNKLRTTERTAEVADMIRNYSKTNGYGDLDQWEDIDIINGFTNENKATRNEIEDYINGEESAFSFSNRMGFGAGDNRSRFDMITRNGGEWNDDILGHFETESYDNADNKVGTWFKNLGKSTYNLASDLTNMVVNPVDTIGNLTKAAVGGVMNITGLDDNVGDEGWFAEANQVADGMGDFLKDRYGGKEQILNTFYQDPAGLISDIASIVAGGAGLAKGGATAVAKTAATTGAKSVARNAGKVANVAGKVMRTANNLDPATMILKGEGKIAGGAYKGAKGVVNAVTSPIETGKKILNSAGEGLDKIGEYGARKITGTTSAQDKLYKAQEPRMNILTRKKDLEKRRANSDRANELIVEYGYKPTDTASRLTAHEATMKKIWNEVEKRVNNDEAVGINQSQLAEKLYDYIKDQKKLGSSLNKADIAALEREMKTLNGKIVDLPTLEKKKQLYNSIINNWGESKVSDVFSNGLKVLTHEIGKIEDSILAEIPGEFQKLKNDFGALKDTYEDVFKADMKNQRKKGLGLVETYSRLEGLGDIASGVLSIFNGGAKDIAKGAGKLVMGKALAKARDVDFLVKEGFEDLYNTRKGLAENQASSKTAKYQVADEPITKDSSGKQLTKQQQEFFKGSKVVDKDGNLLRVYHGTRGGDFTVFKKGNSWSNSLSKVGHWFTPNKEGALRFAEGGWGGSNKARAEEVYLDIKNPKIYEPSEFNLLTSEEKSAKIDEQRKIYNQKADKAEGLDYTHAGGFFHDEYDHPFYERQIFQDLKRSWENDRQYEGKLGKYNPEGYRALAEDFNKRYDANLDYDKILKDFEEYTKAKLDEEKEHTKLLDMKRNDPYDDFMYDIYKLDSTLDRKWTKGDLDMALNDYNSPDKFVENLKKEGYDGIIIKGTEYDGEVIGGGARNDQYVAFDSNQIKRTSNLNPTKNEDIRYQKYGMAGSNEKEINATKGLNIRNFKNGKTVKQLADQYGIKTKIVDKISTPEGQKAYGVYGDRMITLAKDLVESTVPHELLHATFDMVDTAKRKSLLDGIQKRLNVDDVQAEEWLADRFSEYYRKGVFDAKNVPNTLVGQIKEFFKQVKEYIDGTYANRKEIQRLFDDIIDGKLEGEYGVYSDPKFQTVYHGSPADFDKFDSSHMGEGEGAQVHGWGHYVAVDKKTAERYADMKNPSNYEYKGRGLKDIEKELGDSKPGEKIELIPIRHMLDSDWMGRYQRGERFDAIKNEGLKDAKKSLNYSKRIYEENPKGKGIYMTNKERYEIDKRLYDAWNNLDKKDFDFEKPNRNLYNLDIPDPKKADTPTGSNYFEEDGDISKKELEKINNELLKKEGYLDIANNKNLKSVSDMTKEDIENIVKKADKGIYDKVLQEKGIAEKRFQTSFSTLGELFDTQLRGRIPLDDYAKLLTEAGFKPDLDFVYGKNGKEVYRSLGAVLGSDKQASKFLESLGYDGIHYFGGQDGEAYVIFNDDALKINRHEKY